MYSLIIPKQWNSGFEGESMNVFLWKHVGVLRIGALLEWRLHRKLDLRPNQLGQVFFSSQREVIRAPQGTKQMFLTFGQRMPKEGSFAAASFMERTLVYWFFVLFLRPMWNQSIGRPWFFSSGGRGSVVYNAIQTTQLAECYGFQNSNPEKDEPLKPCHSQSTYWSGIFT